ncbi:MAG TPA: deoxyribonuclease IV [Phycisphaerales bacterium]|nr:deoxyribonuclease IV [Phycisphaerales bacterium]HMP36328.1 deoxyribonuclease IV [Phycisphaerales bacterium]
MSAKKGMIGSHLSIAGGMAGALREAEALGLDCVQVFTKNQRQWKAPPLREAERDEWIAALRRLKWDDLAAWRTVSHNSYLVNLASPDGDARARSIDVQCIELERCEALRIPGCVMHPGAHLGERPERPRAAKAGDRTGPPNGTIGASERAGLDRVVAALDEIHRRLRGLRTLTLLETTAGTGTNLGADFAHLAFVRDRVREPERVAFCFDTCHVTAAGYDMSTPAGAEETWQRWDSICGLESIRCVHVNDSEGAVGSRVDRHAHIGEGCCGRSCFQTLMNLPVLAGVPKILETPKGEDARGRPWDRVNAGRLRRMIKSTRPTRPSPRRA